MPASPRVRFVVLAAVLAVGMAPVGAAFAAPSNDALSSAVDVSSLPFEHTVDATDATLEAGEPAPPCTADAGATVWYRITPAVSQRLEAETTGSGYDTVLAVYRGRAFESMTGIACNDDIRVGQNSLSRAVFDLTAGETYYVQVGAYAGVAGTLRLTIDLVALAPPACDGCPTFTSYVPPPELDYRAGETSIGVNPRTNAAMLLLLTHTLRVRWDDSQVPAVARWEEVTGTLTGLGTNDPILWTDPRTGRTFVAQLRAFAGSLIAYTDDDGATWVPTEPGIVLPSWDHQTIGGGAYPAPVANPVYPSALYYCAQTGFRASQCARSDNGGLTWGAPLPMNVDQCAGLHGHVAVGPDGSVYVPHKSCRAEDRVDRQGVMVSRNGGATWELRIVPGTLASDNDPKVAFDRSGRMYFVAESNGTPLVATSEDGGRTWTEPVDVGVPHTTRNTVFPVVVAGDAGRAAFGFYGSNVPGDDQSADYIGDWYPYIAFTYDGGRTWQTVNASPGDPVQRGCIWLRGGRNPCRNLLDFQDMTMDAEGRVLFSYADGCVSEQCLGVSGTPDDSRSSRGVIARQTSGRRLLAAFD